MRITVCDRCKSTVTGIPQSANGGIAEPSVIRFIDRYRDDSTVAEQVGRTVEVCGKCYRAIQEFTKTPVSAPEPVVVS